MRRHALLVVTVFAWATTLGAGERVRVLLISMDGLRRDVITDERMPALRALLQQGAGTLAAVSQQPTFTIPNHVSMVTGLRPSTHGVTFIGDPGDFIVDGAIFEIAHQAGLTVGIYLSKNKLRLLAKPENYEQLFIRNNGSSAEVVDTLVADLGNKASRWNLTFLHITEPDSVGHIHGWMSPEYLDALEVVDSLLERIFAALDSNALRQETLVILTSDHGGSGFTHDQRIPEVIFIPWIVTGPGVASGVRVPCSVGSHDTGPTILHALGLEVPEYMEGRVIESVFEPAPRSFLRGDASADGMINLSDAVQTLGKLFLGGEIRCASAADADGDNRLTISDSIYLLNHLFLGGPPPSAPFPACGVPSQPPCLPCQEGCP